MNIEKIKLLIAEGEGLTVEFKEKHTSKIDRDIVAFANTRGGFILLGVSDNGEIIGEKLTNKLKAEIISMARGCEPHIELGQIKQIDDIVLIEIPKGEEVPYSCSSGYFRRLDAVTQKMSHKEIQGFFQGALGFSFEEKIGRDISWKEISKDKIRKFFNEAKIDYSTPSPQKVLNSLNLSSDGRIKNAGILFFAKQPRRLISQCQMTLVAFKGKDSIHIYDRKDIEDDLLTQYKEAITFLEKHLNIRSEIKGVDRQDIYEIPLEAIRETVANAIIHRDYRVAGTSIMVEIHENRVVISNPGGFPAAMDKTKLGKLSVRRNELIADIFARMHKIERVGSGFRRIKEVLQKAGLPFPAIESNSFFVITFKRPQNQGFGSQKSSQKSSQKIMELIGRDANITIEQMSQVIGISTRAVKKNIQQLKKIGKLSRIGSDKGGSWEKNK